MGHSDIVMEDICLKIHEQPEAFLLIKTEVKYDPQ